MSLSAAAEAEIRHSSKKIDSIAAAKKYIKAMDALSELERAFVFLKGNKTLVPDRP